MGYVFLNEPVVLFRREGGAPVALEDRCAHRRLPLSKGHVIGDTLVCGYHGLTYDCKGTCIHIPGQTPVPSWARVKSYPVVERYGCIWIWMGDPVLADESLVTDLHWADSPGWGARNRLHIQSHYQLISDNLCDLSHLAYIHSKNVGTTALAEHGEVETEINGNNVRVSRWTIDKPAPSAYVAAGGFATNIDRWQISDFSPPAFFKLNFGATPTGTGRDGNKARNRWGFQVCQWATPETEKTSHWFWAIAHDFGPDRNLDAAPLFYPQMYTIVAEDFAAIEAQQRCIDLDPDAPNGAINADSGVLAARRIVARLIAEEQGGRRKKGRTPTGRPAREQRGQQAAR